jgi:hypothetical protein
MPQCPPELFHKSAEGEPGGCSPETQAGIARLLLSSGQATPAAVYNLVPNAGEVARFGLSVAANPAFLDITVRTRTDYGITSSSNNIPAGGMYYTSLTLWGVPAEPSHDSERVINCNGPCEYGAHSTAPLQPLLTNPTTCPGTPLSTHLSMDFNGAPEEYLTAAAELPSTTDCGGLAFAPSMALLPETSQADASSGYLFDLSVPQNDDPNGRAVSQLRDAVVTLPAGVTLNPSVANGLQACTDEQFGMGSTAPPLCPGASVLGTTEVDTPVLPAPLYGHAYVGQPLPGNTYRIFLDMQGDSLDVKLEGRVTPDPVTGQITATFENLPQAPFSHFKLRLKGGATAPLATPPACGQGTLTTALAPWSGNPAATPQSSLMTDFDGHGGACPSPLPFAPSFSAGSSSLVAGANTGFMLTLGRDDRTQYLGGLSVHLPAGLLGRLAGVPLCPLTRAGSGTCEPSSQIGTVSASAGAGGTPFTLPGTVYLAQPRIAGSPASLSVVVPAIAGPFNLGNVVVGADIIVNSDGSITTNSDPLPTIVQGVPLRVRRIGLDINRTGFMINPTSCERMSVTATITSTQGQAANVSSPFQLADCQALAFSPSFTANTSAHTSRANGASLDVKVAQVPWQSNIRAVDVQLPKALPTRLSTLQKACAQAQFAANPASCPPGSVVGLATASTPLLAHPLTGPVILVSHGGEAFPDLDIALQGEGITLDLVGNTDITKGITYSRFETLPDAPITSFELKLPEGPNSVLAANTGLCAPKATITVRKRVTVRRHGRTVRVVRTVEQQVPESLVLLTTIAAQNGARIAQNTKITVNGCATAAKAKAARKKAKTSSRARSKQR